MPEDLVVKAGTTVELNDSPVPGAGSPDNVSVDTLRDLLKDPLDWLIQPQLEELLVAAKTATQQVLSERSTYTPAVFRVGTSLPDLRRYGAFLAEAGEAAQGPRTKFVWNVLRAIDPHKLGEVTLDTQLGSVTPGGNRWLPPGSGVNWVLRGDITIESNGTLAIGPRVHNLSCGNLIIHQDGKIQITGSANIKAASIQGDI